MNKSIALNIVYILLLAIMGITWGLQYALLKAMTDGGYSEPAILTVALASLAMIYLVVLIIRGELFSPNRKHLLFFAIGSLLGYVIPLGAALYVASSLSAGLLILIASFSPIITIAVAAICRTEKVSSMRVAAVVIGLAAAILAVWPSLEIPGSERLTLLAIATIAPLAYGIDGVYIDYFWPKELSATQVVTGEAATAAILMLPICLMTGGPIKYDAAWPLHQWAMIVFIFASVIEVYLFFFLINRKGAVLVGFGSFIALFAGIGWGILFYQESHPLLIWAAVGLLCLALILVSTDTIRAGDKASTVDPG